MTVRELIAELCKFDPDMEMMVPEYHGTYFDKILRVETRNLLDGEEYDNLESESKLHAVLIIAHHGLIADEFLPGMHH